MNKAEFASGWKLLILQPWGRRYAAMKADGEPSEEALTQLDLYFTKLEWAEAKAWHHVVNLFVEGKEWPSIHELKQALQSVNHRYVKALPAPPRYATPEEASEILRSVMKS